MTTMIEKDIYKFVNMEILVNYHPIKRDGFSVILDNYIKYHVEYDNMSEEDARETAIQLFEDDSYEINDWLLNNMNWSEFNQDLLQISKPKKPNYENDWNCSDVIVT